MTIRKSIVAIVIVITFHLLWIKRYEPVDTGGSGIMVIDHLFGTFRTCDRDTGAEEFSVKCHYAGHIW